MTDMYIRTKEAFTRKGTGGLETYAYNTVYQVDTTLGNALISAGLASAETLITPTGKVNITSTAEVNVTDYAKAQVVDANLVAGNIKKDVVILGTTGTYEAPASDFSTATVTYTVPDTFASFRLFGSFAVSPNEHDTSIFYVNQNGSTSHTMTATVILYKGTAIVAPDNISVETYDITVTGDGELSEGMVVVTGNCAITVTAKATEG